MTSAGSLLRSCALVALALALGAGAADANSRGAGANLTDVRVGVHPSHTRIVIETDAAAPYVVDPSGEELLIHVDAASTAEAVTAKSPHLIWVEVEPTTIGTDVRVQLKHPVDVKPLVLTRPDRIVLDLYPRSGGALAEATPIPAPELLPEEAEAPELSEAKPPAPLAPTPDELEAELGDEPGLPLEDEPEEPLVLELPEEVEAPERADAMDAEAELEEGAEAAPEGEALEGELEEGGEELAEAPAQQARRPGSPTTPAAPAPASGSRFGSPFALAATALVLLALFVWLRRRLRTAEPSPIPPLPDETPEPSPFALPTSGVAPAVEASEADGSDSVFDVEPDALEEHEALPVLRSAARSDLEPADETERRIAHLEKKLEELAESKDRLERQIAAQTEELRVQRAAIARTQRVLRSIAPKDDESSEPLVRG